MKMIEGTRKKSGDGREVLVVEYHSTRETTVGAMNSLSLLEGVRVETTHGVCRITKVGAAFKAGKTRLVYLYIEPADVADDLSAVIAAKLDAASRKRYDDSFRPAAPMHGFTPKGW